MIRRQSMFDLAAEEVAAYQEIIAAAEELAYTEDTPQDADALDRLAKARERFHEAASRLAGKADAVAGFIRDMDAAALAAAEEEERLRGRKKRFEAAGRRVTAYVIEVMKTMGKKTLDGDHVTISRRLNPEAVEVKDPSAVPDEFKRLPTPPGLVPDRELIRNAIRAGREVPGAVLVQRERLEIK